MDSWRLRGLAPAQEGEEKREDDEKKKKKKKKKKNHPLKTYSFAGSGALIVSRKSGTGRAALGYFWVIGRSSCLCYPIFSRGRPRT